MGITIERRTVGAGRSMLHVAFQNLVSTYRHQEIYQHEEELHAAATVVESHDSCSDVNLRICGACDRTHRSGWDDSKAPNTESNAVQEMRASNIANDVRPRSGSYLSPQITPITVRRHEQTERNHPARNSLAICRPPANGPFAHLSNIYRLNVRSKG